MLPPPNWEYMKVPWYFGLVIKVFCRDPQLALDVADVMADGTNAPLSRAELKRQRQKEALEGNSKKKSSTNASTTSSSDSPSLCSPGDGGGNEPCVERDVAVPQEGHRTSGQNRIFRGDILPR